MSSARRTTTIPAPDRTALEALKIGVLASGVRVSAAALQHLGGPGRLTVHEYATTGGIPLRVGGLDVNAPFDEWYCAGSEIALDLVGGVPTLHHSGSSWPVDHVHPLPGYVGTVDDHGESIDQVVFSHIDRLRISPLAGCAYDCAFCNLPGRLRLRPVSQLLAAADTALADEELDIRHALISGGSPGPRMRDSFGSSLETLVRTLAPRLEVDVMMAPGPDGPDLVRRLVDAGVNGFAINLEVESADAASVHIRGKHRRARPHYDATVSAAVELLGSTGRVRSLILPGLESLEATLAGVAHIAALGADPVLSPFRPARDTVLARRHPTTPSLLREVLDGSRVIVDEHDVRLGPRCLPCQHNTLTFPWDVE